MLLKKTISTFSICALSVAMLATACKSDEQKKEETVTTVTTDSTLIKSSNGSVDSAIVTIDSSVLTKTVTTKTIVLAKPNPAKKGGKGKGGVTMMSKGMQKMDNMPMEMDKEGYYNRVDVLPSYPGGQKALEKFVENNIVYPNSALNEGVEGTVDVLFAVDENGNVYTPMTKGEKVGYGLDEEAARVIGKMPKWNPGSIKGKNVKTRFTLPITFQIN